MGHKLIKKCLNCGREYQAHKVRQMWCSEKCSVEGRRKNPTKPEDLNKICPYCKKKFKAMRRHKVFCSPRCAARDNWSVNHKPTFVECPICKKQFRKLGGEKYCSPLCSKLGQELNSYGYWQAPLIASCPACGKETFLIRHHKDFNRNNNAEDNLEYICKSCHCLRHIGHKHGNTIRKPLNMQRSIVHFNKRYSDKGGMKQLRKLLKTGWGGSSRAAEHFGVSKELVRQWRFIYDLQ